MDHLRASSRTVVLPLMLLGFALQLGICPCGCLEHNYWTLMARRLLAVGGPTDSIQLAVKAAAVPRADGPLVDPSPLGWDHACDGRPRECYVDQRTELGGRMDAGRMLAVSGLPAPEASHGGRLARDFSSARRPSGAVVGNAALSRLQVFLL